MFQRRDFMPANVGWKISSAGVGFNGLRCTFPKVNQWLNAMMELEARNFERIINDKQTRLYRCSNKGKLEAAFSNYGARIIALYFDGLNVTPSYSTLEAYQSPT